MSKRHIVKTYSVTAIMALFAVTVTNAANAQTAPVQVNPGAVLGSQYQGYIPGQPSLSSVILPKDLQRRPDDPNVIQYSDGMIPVNGGKSESSLQGVISTPDGHTYISP